MSGKRTDDVKVVLVRAQYEGNIGFVARAMKNFGFSELCLVKPDVDRGRVARAYSMHAYDIVEHARVFDSVEEAVADADFTVATTACYAKNKRNLRRNTISIDTALPRFSGKVAILFGRESSGLRNDELDQCDCVVTIPANPDYATMNVSHAAAIVLYELSKRQRNHMSKGFAASRQEKERVITYFTDILDQLRLQPHKKRLSERAFRNIIGRSFITSREATLLMGVFRKILHRAEKS